MNKRPSWYRGASEGVLAGDDAPGWRRYAFEPDGMRPGHRARVLRDGAETFPAMLEAIRQARHYVHFETYILVDDAIGIQFADALRERAADGVEVRLLIDGFGSMSLPDVFVAQLQQDGVDVAHYEPIWESLPGPGTLRRDHRKILITDGETAFVGGINISMDYVSEGIGGKGWRDTHLRIQGPAVADLESLFHGAWRYARGAPYPLRPREADESVSSPGTELAMAIATGKGRRSAIRRHLLHAIRAAERSVYIANAYFIPDRALIRSLRQAASRGVDVKILVPSDSDVPVVQWAGEWTYARLLSGGVKLYQWRRGHMHAKTVVIDELWSAVGSYNLDYVSLFLNNEVVVELVGKQFARSMAEMFAADLERSEPVEATRWNDRHTPTKFLQWAAYRARRFL